MKNGVAIGIDLGTRNALCACLKNGNAVMIPNRWGRTSTPSVVGWNGDWVVGEDAVRLSLQGGRAVWWDIKRKVGSDFCVSCGGTTWLAQDLLVPLLRMMREDAEAFVGDFASSCVLAVPVCFSLLQKEAMMQAAWTAGMREARIVSEPTAAALAFGGEGRFLVLDFGAGTVDLSVVESEGGVRQVLESTGSALVGGYDFDLALAEWLRERLRLAPLPPGDPVWRTLILEAEAIKIALSSCRSYCWTPPALSESIFAPFRIEREDLERMVRFSIRRLVHAVHRLWDRYKPEHLLLVGGSSRIPLLRDILEREVARPERLSLCAEESIAAGAALYTRAGKERLLLDVLSGNVEILVDGKSAVLIPSGTPLPFSSCSTFGPLRSGMTELSVFQDCGDLQEGRRMLAAVTPGLSGEEDAELCCSLSTSGLLRVSVRQGDRTVEVPLLPLREKDGASRAPVRSRRLRELKLRLTPLEILLSPQQQDRLHALVRRIENIENDDPSVEILEKLVNELETAVS